MGKKTKGEKKGKKKKKRKGEGEDKITPLFKLSSTTP